jgi:SAM-dependent methyltransferase
MRKRRIATTIARTTSPAGASNQRGEALETSPRTIFMKSRWDNYVKKAQEQPIPVELASAVKLLKKRGLALDVGSGSGNFSKYLIDKRFMVEAIDIADSAIKSTKEKAGESLIVLVQADLNTFPILGNYTLILAWRSIPFLKAGNDIVKYEEIKNALVGGGIFVFSVFGKEDDWAKNGTVCVTSVKKLKTIFKGFEFLSINEKKYRGAGVSGKEKNWHFIQGIAQKK